MEGASIAVQRFLESFGRVNGQLDDQALQPAKTFQSLIKTTSSYNGSREMIFLLLS